MVFPFFFEIQFEIGICITTINIPMIATQPTLVINKIVFAIIINGNAVESITVTRRVYIMLRSFDRRFVILPS